MLLAIELTFPEGRVCELFGIGGACFTFKNKGALTTHLVSLWIIDSTIHRRYDIDLIINSGETLSYVRSDIHLPKGQYVVKVVTERGNIAIYSND